MAYNKAVCSFLTDIVRELNGCSPLTEIFVFREDSYLSLPPNWKNIVENLCNPTFSTSFKLHVLDVITYLCCGRLTHSCPGISGAHASNGCVYWTVEKSIIALEFPKFVAQHYLFWNKKYSCQLNNEVYLLQASKFLNQSPNAVRAAHLSHNHSRFSKKIRRCIQNNKRLFGFE